MIKIVNNQVIDHVPLPELEADEEEEVNGMGDRGDQPGDL